MFHSRGMVQSKTGVPVGTSWISRAMCAADLAQRLPDAVAGYASANRIDLGGQRKDFLADVIEDQTIQGRSAISSGRPDRRRLRSRPVQVRSCRCGGLAGAARVPQLAVENAVGQQFLDVADALIARSLEFLQRDA